MARILSRAPSPLYGNDAGDTRARGLRPLGLGGLSTVAAGGAHAAEQNGLRRRGCAHGGPQRAGAEGDAHRLQQLSSILRKDYPLPHVDAGHPSLISAANASLSKYGD